MARVLRRLCLRALTPTACQEGRRPVNSSSPFLLDSVHVEPQRIHSSAYSRESLISSSELSRQSLSNNSAVEEAPTLIPTLFREHSFS